MQNINVNQLMDNLEDLRKSGYKVTTIKQYYSRWFNDYIAYNHATHDCYILKYVTNIKDGLMYHDGYTLKHYNKIPQKYYEYTW